MKTCTHSLLQKTNLKASPNMKDKINMDKPIARSMNARTQLSPISESGICLLKTISLRTNKS